MIFRFQSLSKFVFSFFTVFLFSNLAFAGSDYLAVANNALQKLDQIDSEHWSYKHVRKSAKETTSSYFDPRRTDAQKWQLLLVNNKVPTVDEINEFNEIWNQVETISEQESSELSEEQSAGMSKMVAADSLVLDRTNDGVAYFHFSPQLDDMPQESDKLAGELSVDIKSQQVIAMSIKNKEPLTPAFSIQLDNFTMNFEFDVVDQKPVYRKIVMDMSGTAGFVKDISEQTVEEFSEYYYVGPNS